MALLDSFVEEHLGAVDCLDAVHGEVFHISRERDDIVSATADVADRNIVGFILGCVSRAV